MMTVRELMRALQSGDQDALVRVKALPTDYRDGGCWDGERWTFALERIEVRDHRVYLDCHPDPVSELPS